ncbi:MAG: YebC/PmpR family DNA-binding transcriptional regulator [Acidimicrobiales bacterium]|jgi:YebC/PmpR family DNA-binding regulatory protein|nr:YebC/PmpR family DNA-binding transcriptional regulator [Acidimicrobiales bacterium]HLV91321.1 YebC/PmpR family DNA-binding transcriptional regulator [Acidimicrobiia bacterium]
MAGHSKWANIKHRKGRQDAARGKLFGKLAKAIEIAAREGGGNPEFNPTLATAVYKAKAASMPNDNIERAIKRGTGEVEGATYEEIWYEGYGPGGVALYVQILTDNRNRAASEVRATFTRNNGNLGEPGSVGYLFSQKGLVVASGSEDDILLTALDAGAEDVIDNEDGTFEIVTAPSDLGAVRVALEEAGIEVVSADITQRPSTWVPVAEADARKLLRLIDALDDLDDVQAVHANYDIDDEVMEKVMAEA